MKAWLIVLAIVLFSGFVAFSAGAGSSCYTCTSSSTGKCKGMMYCRGSAKACKAAGCKLGSSSKTSCPTSANYRAKTCTP